MACFHGQCNSAATRGSRLRDGYLEQWGRGLTAVFALAIRVGTFARPIAYMRQRAALRQEERPPFDTDFSVVLRRAIAQTLSSRQRS